VLRIQFADRRACILNRQAAAQQLWLAEGAEAWHFQWDTQASAWMDTKGRGRLETVLAQVLSRRLSRAIQL
jgi:iron donor protein CyaY